jgi:hypothetical protein
MKKALEATKMIIPHIGEWPCIQQPKRMAASNGFEPRKKWLRNEKS